MQRAAHHLLSAWLIAFLAAGPARAAPTLVPRPDFYAGKGGTKLLVVVAPVDARAKSLAGLVEQAAETAADSSDRFQALRGIDAFDATAAAARAAKETEAKALAAEGQKALDDLDSAKASKLFADAVAAWMKADLSRGIEGLVEAQIGDAAGHATSEENPQSKADLDRALVLAPKAKLSDAHFPPELLKYADAQRAKLAKAKGKLTVRTEPPGARVWIDGLYRGTSPVTAEGMGAGQHIVTAGLAGWGLTTDDLPPGDQLLKLKPAESAAQLQAALERIVQDPEGPGRDQAAKELGAAARADQVLVLVVKKGQSADQLELSAARIDATDGHVYASRAGTPVAAELRALGDSVAGLLTADEPRGAGNTPSSKSKGKGGGLSGMRIAGIGLLGGAVAAGASWAIFGISALGRASQYRSTFQVETMKSNQAARDGRTFALVADISWAVGAAFLVAGLLLVILGGSGGSGGSKAAKPGGGEDDALKEYRRHQEEQRRLEEERQRKAAEQPPAEPPKEEKKPEEQQKPPEEKKAEEAKPPPPEEKKKLTPAEEKAEKKRKAEEEKAEKKRKAEEEKAEKKRLAEEAKKKAQEEKAEKKRQAEEAKKKAEEEKAEKKRAAEEEKKKAEEDKKRAEEDKKRAAEEEEKKKKEEEQRKADEEARRMDEERKRKEEEQRKREEERKNDDAPPPPKKNDLDEDLRDDE